MVIGHFYDKMRLVRCTNQISNVCSVDHSVSFSVFTDHRKEELMGWHARGVTKTRARVIGVNFSEFLIKEKEI